MGSPAIGNAFLGLALLASAISIIALWWGDRLGEDQGEGVTNFGYLATFGVLATVTLSAGILIAAFMGEDFGFKYVAENHSTDVSGLAWLYRLSGIWAGREGSLLFWEWLLAMFAAWVAYKRLSVTDRLSNVALAVTNFVQIFFLVALFIQTNNPFQVTPAEWLAADGTLLVRAAMNPLLQHWAMILHPPTLFVGYAGLAIPFAYAVAAVFTGDGSSAWVKLVDRIAVFSWLFLGIGIGLGAIWAYVVLGWGGYWAWDPVENASLLPWLTGVALLHSFTVYRRRDGFKGWAVMMASVTFMLVLLGTFITRSGIVQSVHAFQEDPASFWLVLIMMIATIAVPGIALLARRDSFRGKEEMESLFSKEVAYYFNNVIMLFSAVFVAYMTLTPAFPKLFGVGGFAFPPWAGQSFGPDTYNPIAWFLGVVNVLILAVCPILSWKRTEGTAFWSRAKIPLLGAAGLGAAFLAIWWFQLRPHFTAENPQPSTASAFWHNIWAPFGLVVAALAIVVPIYLFASGAKKRAAAREESFGKALLNILVKARQQSGGYITHLGIGIILMGLIGSAMFVLDVKTGIPAEEGASFEASDYEFTFQGTREVRKENGDVELFADFTVLKDGGSRRTISPSLLTHFVQNQTTLNVDIIYEPLRDVFFIFEGGDETGISVNVKINPLISYVWLGFFLTIVGTTVAVWPKRAAA